MAERSVLFKAEWEAGDAPGTSDKVSATFYRLGDLVHVDMHVDEIDKQFQTEVSSPLWWCVAEICRNQLSGWWIPEGISATISKSIFTPDEEAVILLCLTSDQDGNKSLGQFLIRLQLDGHAAAKEAVSKLSEESNYDVFLKRVAFLNASSKFIQSATDLVNLVDASKAEVRKDEEEQEDVGENSVWDEYSSNASRILMDLEPKPHSFVTGMARRGVVNDVLAELRRIYLLTGKLEDAVEYYKTRR